MTTLEKFDSYEDYLNWFWRERPAKTPFSKEEFYRSLLRYSGKVRKRFDSGKGRKRFEPPRCYPFKPSRYPPRYYDKDYDKDYDPLRQALPPGFGSGDSGF